MSEHLRSFNRSRRLQHASRRRISGGKRPRVLQSLFLQKTRRRGVLMPFLVVSYTHDNGAIARTTGRRRRWPYPRALDGGAERLLVGRPSQLAFRRFNHAGEPARIIPIAENKRAAAVR
jgi:glutamate-1-semialdehyde 2,1-aminomutase